MKFFNLTLLCASLIFASGCIEDASVSEVEQNSIEAVDDVVSDQPITIEEPIDEIMQDDVDEEMVDDAPIVIDVEDNEEVESDDEVIADEEIAEDNEEVDSDDNSVDEPVDQPVEDPKEEDEDDKASDEEEDVVIEEDENDDEKCRRRGNLIRNGSFEIVDDRKGLRGKSLESIKSKSWDVFDSLPSKVEDEDSWYTSDGPGIEIQGDKTVTPAAHGLRMVELDSHGGPNTNSTMSQDVYLCRGRHILKFNYYPRTNALNDNTIEVSVNDKVIKLVDMKKSGKWIRIRAPFKVNKKGSYKISFAAKGNDNSLGGLIDKVKLRKKKRRAGVVTSLLSLGDKDNIASPMIRKEIAMAVISKAVNFASIKRKPRILFLKDNFHGGESLDDFDFTESVLKELFGETKIDVISGEVRMADVKDYDVIYILNPGHPMGSEVTRDTLMEVKELGNVGIVIMGDDMARGRRFKLEELTGLKYKSNGTSACGIRIDNNKSKHYSVKLKKRFFKKLTPESRILTYGNDIDHTVILNKKIKVLAKAKAPNNCGVDIPTIVGYKLKRQKINKD